MKRLFYGFAVSILILSFQLISQALPKVDALLSQKINAAPLSLTPVVITFNSKPTSADFLMLKSLGIVGGYKTGELPMVLTLVNKTQFNALKQKSNIRSLYANRVFRTMETESSPKWITYAEAQRLTSLGRTTLWRICSTGAVETARVGKAVRINRNSLDEFMKQHATQPRLPGFDDVT